MAAHDDDRDLVTIRIPRRAAALFAAELDVASSSWMVKAGVYGGIVGSSIGLLVAAALLATGIFQVVVQNLFLANICFGMFAIAALISFFLLALSLQRLRAARNHGLL